MSLGTDLSAAVALVVTDAALLRAIVQGPASGPTSIVTLPGGAQVKTIARAASEIPGGAVIMDGNGDAGVTRRFGAGVSAPVEVLDVRGHAKFGSTNLAGLALGDAGSAVGSGTSVGISRADSAGTAAGNYLHLHGYDGIDFHLNPGANLLAPAAFTARLNSAGLTLASTLRAVATYLRAKAAEYPKVEWESSANSANIKKWQMYCDPSGNLNIGALNDAEDSQTGGFAFANTGGAFRFEPAADNAQTLGGASTRWSVVYAGTGTINTSGRDAKLSIQEGSAAEKRAALAIRAGARKYQFADAVEAKGDAARWHFGYIAEDVRDALAAEGLNPWAYGFLCSDPILKRETYFETVKRAKKRKAMVAETAVEIIDGKPVMVRKEVERDEPVGEYVAVVDEAGQPVLHQMGRNEETGEPIMAPLMHFVPEMEEYEVERTREVDTGEVRLGLRYSELEAFLRSAD